MVSLGVVLSGGHRTISEVSGLDGHVPFFAAQAKLAATRELVVEGRRCVVTDLEPKKVRMKRLWLQQGFLNA